MTNLIQITDSTGRIYACGPQCYNGTVPQLDCPCLGHNYKRGYHSARMETTVHWKDWLKQWQRDHQLRTIVWVRIRGQLMPNFLWEN